MGTTNEGTLDRSLRLALSLSLFTLTFTLLTGTWQLIAGGLGLMLLITAALGFCPLYQMFGISTCAVRTPVKR